MLKFRRRDRQFWIQLAARFEDAGWPPFLSQSDLSEHYSTKALRGRGFEIMPFAVGPSSPVARAVLSLSVGRRRSV
jgi:hypothetical protein